MEKRKKVCCDGLLIKRKERCWWSVIEKGQKRGIGGVSLKKGRKGVLVKCKQKREGMSCWSESTRAVSRSGGGGETNV